MKHQAGNSLEGWFVSSFKSNGHLYSMAALTVSCDRTEPMQAMKLQYPPSTGPAGAEPLLN
jgi:hypothetical protein